MMDEAKKQLYDSLRNEHTEEVADNQSTLL